MYTDATAYAIVTVLLMPARNMSENSSLSDYIEWESRLRREVSVPQRLQGLETLFNCII